MNPQRRDGFAYALGVLIGAGVVFVVTFFVVFVVLGWLIELAKWATP